MSAVRHKPADPLRRLMSAVYEGVILFGVVFFFAYAFSSLTSFKGGEGPLRTAFQLYLFLVLGTYFTWFWSRGRRTLPMKTMGVVLVGARDHAPLTPARAAWRYLVASIMFWGLLAAVWKASVWWLPLWPLPFAWSMFNQQRQTLYDLVAGTVLVEQAPAAEHRPRAGPVGRGSGAGAEAAAPLRSSIDPAARRSAAAGPAIGAARP